MPGPDKPSTLAGVSPVKLALLAQQARAESEAILRADPIAIVGMGCRFPGAENPDAFWRLLRDGVDAVSEVPADRWNAEDFYDSDPAAPGKSVTKSGGFLKKIDGFDAEFFGILRREAERMDPQHRLFLEVATEALDHAGLPRDRLAGSRTGVFIASYHSDYAKLLYQDLDQVDARTLTGSVHSVLANRLSYLLDLRGPSISVDTACSSSLVAVHLACQSLRYGESDIAMAGGVSLMVTPDLMVALSKVGFMAPDGRCKTFDASADGFGRAEGCGVVVLKRLADAIKDGDRVLALIRGSAVNQDGHSTVISAPNGLAQQALIREALANAQLAPGRIGFVEAHGTGTALGDPIEVEALAATIGQIEEGAGPCFIGAAKANLGHMEAAAGVGGLIKSVLVLRNEAVPPQVHFKSPNPHLTLEGTRLQVPMQLTPWPSGAVSRCIGTSGFGVGGSNAHVILEEAPKLASPEEGSRPAAQILPLSAQSVPALRALAQTWTAYLPTAARPHAMLCAAAAQRRSHFDYRCAVTGSSAEALRTNLATAIEAMETAPPQRRTGPARTAFIFCGQGSQWVGMGRELFASEPVFRDAVTAIDAALRPYSGWSLIEKLEAPEERSRLQDTEVAQPAIFAIQVGLAALWESWGVVPDAVAGHSIGEIAAFHAAGILSLDDAVRIVWRRAQAMQAATGLGGMAAVALSEEEAVQEILSYGDDLSVAAVNAPRSVVLSGRRDALDMVLANLAERGVSSRSLAVNYAFHSAQMAPFAAQLTAALDGVTFNAPRIAVYSTVTGARLGADELDIGYFGRNIRQPVRFANAVAALMDDGVGAFVEIGPHPVLAASLAEIQASAGAEATMASSLRRGRGERETMLQAVAVLYGAGAAPHWEAVQGGFAEVIDLPAYPWQRQRYWIETHPTTARRETAPTNANNILGVRISSPCGDIFQAAWPPTAPAWLADHQVGGRIVVPGAAMLDALWRAGRDAIGRDDVQLADFIIHQPLVLRDAETIWQTSATPPKDGQCEVRLHQQIEPSAGGRASWRLIASANVSEGMLEPGASPVVDGAPIKLDYDAFARLGVAFGDAFRTVASLTIGAGVAQAHLAATVRTTDDGVHPTLLDGAWQVCAAAAGARGAPAELLLPIGVERYAVLRPADGPLNARVSWRRGEGGSLTADATLLAASGDVVAVMQGVRFAPAGAAALEALGQGSENIYEVGWTPAPALTGAALAPGAWIVLADESRVGDGLCAALRAKGNRVLAVRRSAEGAALRQADDASWSLDPANPAQFDALFSDDQWRGGAPLAGVVHLWSLDEPPFGEESIDADLLAAGSGLHLVQAALRKATDAAIWLVTHGAQAVADDVRRPVSAGLWGLLAAVAEEHPELNCRLLDLDPDAAPAPAALLAELAGAAGPSRLAHRGSQRLVPALQPFKMRTDAPQPLRLHADKPDAIESLAWKPGRAAEPRAGEVRLSVTAAGLNFRDVLFTLGMYPGGDVALGAECAGVVESVGSGVITFKPDQQVFGFVPGSLASQAVAPDAFLAPAPANLRPIQAAAQPAAYLTAMLGLERIAALAPGQRVLIHAGAGGVGMAAIRLALRRGAEVFATAGSAAKRSLLRRMGVALALDSRSLNFADDTLSATKGAGVDVVLNSLSGDFIAAGLSAVARGGWFLELGKRGIWSPEQMAVARPDVRYRVYDLGEELAADHGLAREMMTELAARLEAGELQPLPVRVFDSAAVQNAFRLMSQGRHTGKLVVRTPGSPNVARASAPIARADATYWITGGLGAIGLKTARWLARSGARHIVLTGRRPPGDQARTAIAACEALGATVSVFAADVGDPAAIRAVLEAIQRKGPPLRGIVHAAGETGDGVVMQQSLSRLRAVLRGKARGAFVLHELTAGLPLDFFILYSTAGVLLGPAGQATYAAANAELDALAHARRSMGLPALSVAWGLWRDGGMAQTGDGRGEKAWTARGLGEVAESEAFAQLERLLRNGAAHAAVLPIDWRRFLAGRADPHGYFNAVVRGQGPRPAAATAKGIADDWRALPESQRAAAVQASLRKHAFAVIGLDPATTLAARTPLKEAGLDSLMAVELRNAVSRTIGQPLPATLLFDYPSLDDLTLYLLRKLKLLSDRKPDPDLPRNGSDVAAAVAALTDDEAEAELLAELNANSGSAT
jgi:acyl transferase domain-containing protein/NAD(P)-dependent dehydrogenase (short-subunit alcohol dehydrogenase family)